MQFGVGDRGDVALKFGPESVGVLGGGLNEIGHQGRAGELVGRDFLCAEQLGGKPALVIINLGLDADNGALFERFEDHKCGIVAEAVEVEGASLVAELHREKGIAGLGGALRQAPNQQHAGEDVSAGAVEGLDVSDSEGRSDVGHGGKL